MRLQKYLADCGVASRRKAEEMIAAGRVRVDGNAVTAMGFVVEEGMRVEADGKTVRPSARGVYIMLNKPQGVITTADDPQGRKTVLEVVGHPERIFPVGRLDYDTQGLLLLTNDGALANRLTHPRHGVDKLYRARVRGEIDRASLRRLEEGIALDDGYKAAPAKVEVVSRGSASELLITVTEGHNRLIRRMCDAIGHPVAELTRVGFGPLRLGHLKVGAWRNLTATELERLR